MYLRDNLSGVWKQQYEYRSFSPTLVNRHWLRFFLVAVIETAKASTETFRSVFALRTETSQTLAALGRSAPNANRVVVLRRYYELFLK